MPFTNLDLQAHYDSDETDVLASFYRPLLSAAKRYDRAVGYFSSSTFKSCALELANFINQGGKIRLIIGCLSRAADAEALATTNLDDKEEDRAALKAQIVQHLLSLQTEDPEMAGTFARMVDSGVIELKFALRDKGIYHEKFGIFADSLDNKIAFIGSLNETQAAIYHGYNHESISVYQSSESTIYKKYGLELEEKFNRLWIGKAKNTRIISLDAETLQIIKNIAKRLDLTHKELDVPNGANYISDLWEHQKSAIEKILEEKHGIFEMATGTGKTKTSLALIFHLLHTEKITNVIVSSKGNDLLRQWAKQLISKSAQTNLFRLYEHIGDGRRQIDDYLLDCGTTKCILIISNENLDKALRNINRNVRQKTLLIFDEVHNIGSLMVRAKLKGLNSEIAYVLGLSATPLREYDEQGNEFVENFVGKTIYTYGVDSAIRDGILCPFSYHPLPYQASPEDGERIKSVYSRKAARLREGNPMSETELFIELSKVYKLSKEKIPVFENFIENNKSILNRAIIFVEETDYGNLVLDVIHKYKPDFHTYYSDDDSETLSRFASGELDCLVTCHKVSEGIDIKSLNSVILFSSARAKLETVQRIGRCLRSDPTNPQKIANVVDFIRIDDDKGNSDREREQWLTDLSKIRRKAKNDD
jgi:superfamily II DNA or RNA helicase